MRLLVITQVMDRSDPALGFFVRWVEEFAKRIQKVEVLCLKKGNCSMPVHSLGKESRKQSGMKIVDRIVYMVRFFATLIRIRGNYDTVFVHMNEEYVLLAGLYWRLCGIPVYLWRNHYEGSWRTRLAVALSTKTFCTSAYSYTAQFKKTVIMPVGVDTESLHTDTPVERVARSILFLARFDRSKKPHLLVEALGKLKSEGVSFHATFVGGQSDPTSGYQTEVANKAKELGIDTYCDFIGAVPNTETFRYYRASLIYVNCAGSGMLDKTVFKAAAAGCLVATSSLDIAKYVDKRCVFQDGNADELKEVLKYILAMSGDDKEKLRTQYVSLVEQNTLPVLMDKLVVEMNKA